MVDHSFSATDGDDSRRSIFGGCFGARIPHFHLRNPRDGLPVPCPSDLLPSRRHPLISTVHSPACPPCQVPTNRCFSPHPPSSSSPPAAVASSSPTPAGNKKGEGENQREGEVRRCSPRSTRSSSARPRGPIRTGSSSLSPLEANHCSHQISPVPNLALQLMQNCPPTRNFDLCSFSFPSKWRGA